MRSSEIDIMEFLGHQANVVNGTLHYHTFDGQQRTSSGNWKSGTGHSHDFHGCALECEPDAIRCG